MAWWPRCTPSKFPMASTVRPGRGSASRERKICMRLKAVLKLDRDAQAIIGKAHMRGKRGFSLNVLQLMRDVGEEGAGRLNSIDPVEGLRNIVVAGMMIPAQRIDDEDVEVFEKRQASVG